jgi:uncharacterized protein YndB with AHSA1/START domain
VHGRPPERTWPPLVFNLTLAAPPETVWRALTDPAELTRWLARAARTEGRPGGSFELRWDDLRIAGRYLQFEPPRRLRFTWGQPESPFPETVIVVNLQPRDGGTALSWEHYGFGRGEGWDEYYVGSARAWAGYLKNLRSVLETGHDLREDDE